MNEDDIEKLYWRVVESRNMQMFRSWLNMTDQDRYAIICHDLKANNAAIFNFLKGF